MGQHRVRPERADLADELLSKRQLVRKGTVGLVQERDPRVADDLRGASLLDFTQRCQIERIESGVLTARVTARTADQPARRSRVDPARGRRRGSEIRVVGMSHDHHEPVGPPRVMNVRRRRNVARSHSSGAKPGGVQDVRAALAVSRVARTSAACPSALTFGHAYAMRPSGSIRKLERWMPMYWRP